MLVMYEDLQGWVVRFKNTVEEESLMERVGDIHARRFPRQICNRLVQFGVVI